MCKWNVPVLHILLLFGLIGLTACSMQGSILDSRALLPALDLKVQQSGNNGTLDPNQLVYTKIAAIKIDAVFNRNIEKLDENLVQVINGSVQSVKKIDNSHFEILLNADQNGLVRMKLTEGAAIDWAGAPSATSDWVEAYYDSVPPVISNAVVGPALVAQGVFPTVSGTTEKDSSLVLYHGLNCAGTELATSKVTSGVGDFTMQSSALTSDGNYNLSVLATDLAGNTFCTSVPLTYTLDRLPPVLAVLTPALNTPYQTGATITGLCEDVLPVTVAGSGIQGPLMVSCNSGNFTTNVTFSSGEGPKNITFVQTDLAGNTGTVNFDLIRDNTSPTLAIAGPAAGTYYQSDLTLTGNCETGLTVHITGVGLQNPVDTACSAGAFSQLVSLSVGEGTKTITVSQTDLAGNSSSESRSFIRDNTSPVLSIASPAVNSEMPEVFTITGTCESGINDVVISGSGVAASSTVPCTSGSFTKSVTLSATDGVKTINFAQTDWAGNVGITSLSVIRDTTAPSVPVINLVYGVVQDNPVPVSLSSCADTNQASVSYNKVIYVIDSAATPSLTDAGWTSCAAGNSNLTLSGEGAHSIRLWARDNVGNLSVSNVLNMTLDTITPTWISIVTTLSTVRDTTGNVPGANIQSSEESVGGYSLLTPVSTPKCSDYGVVSIDAATGALSFVPTTNYYNFYGVTNYNGGPCHVLVQFADLVSPTAHTVTKDIAVTVDWNNGINNNPNITAWPGTNGTAAEKCGNKCFANSIFDLSFTADQGGGVFRDPQNLTCTATTVDSYYVDIASCSVTGNAGTLSLMMGTAHASATDTTTITLTVSDGMNTVSKTFNVHVDNYVLSMYPALAASGPISCLMCHANVQADMITDFGVAKANYSNASSILGFNSLHDSAIYHEANDSVNFSVSGAIYVPNITVTDKNFIKQVTGNPNSGAINLTSFLTNNWTMNYVARDANNAIITDADGFVKLSGTTAAKAPVFPVSRVSGGLVNKTSVTIRAPSDSEILGLAATLSAGVTGFVYRGPNSKPSLSGLEVFTYGTYGDGDHKFVRNNGTIVCYGSIVISGPLYLKNPDIQTDDVGCSIYVAGNVFIETDRAQAIGYMGPATSPTLQITSSQKVHMGIGLYDMIMNRGTGASGQAMRIVNAANPSGLRDSTGVAMSIKSNGDAGAFSYMTCPLNPTHAGYLDAHYISNGNYSACTATDCGIPSAIFNGWTGVVTNYDHVSSDNYVYNGSSLVNSLTAYETMCRLNSGWQMGSYASYGWSWSGLWGEVPTTVGASTINALRTSTTFTHFRVNGQAIHSRYFGTFNGSVISPYALFAIGNLTFTYDSRLNSVVPYPKLMSPNPIFDVQ